MLEATLHIDDVDEEWEKALGKGALDETQELLDFLPDNITPNGNNNQIEEEEFDFNSPDHNISTSRNNKDSN